MMNAASTIFDFVTGCVNAMVNNISDAPTMTAKLY